MPRLKHYDYNGNETKTAPAKSNKPEKATTTITHVDPTPYIPEDPWDFQPTDTDYEILSKAQLDLIPIERRDSKLKEFITKDKERERERRKFVDNFDEKIMLPKIEQLAMSGARPTQIALALNIPYRVWLSLTNEKENPKLAPLISLILRKGLDHQTDLIEKALAQNAKGYEVVETTTTVYKDANGQVTSTKTETQIRKFAANVIAQIFWLKNRRPEAWKDKQDVEHSGAVWLAFDGRFSKV
jgi:hypothetical protein